MIVVETARGRIAAAVAILGIVNRLPDDAMTKTVAECVEFGYLDGSDVPAFVPRSWRIDWLINRAADEARHGAQEALDEVAHSRGWPR
jgi:hypothetical protein